MNNNDLKNYSLKNKIDLNNAIAYGVIQHNKHFRESFESLNVDVYDIHEIISRIIQINNFLVLKHKGEGLSNKRFIVTNKKIYDELKSDSFFDTLCYYFNDSIYIVDDKIVKDKKKKREDYVCVGLKDDYRNSYTFKIG